MTKPEFAVILPANHQVGNNSSAALISEGYSRCLAEFAELHPKTVPIELLERICEPAPNGPDDAEGLFRHHMAVVELRRLLNAR